MEKHYIFSNKEALLHVLTHNPGLYTGRCHSIAGDYKESHEYLPMLYHNVDNKAPDIYKKVITPDLEPIDPIPASMRRKKHQKGNGFDKSTEEALHNPIKV